MVAGDEVLRQFLGIAGHHAERLLGTDGAVVCDFELNEHGGNRGSFCAIRSLFLRKIRKLSDEEGWAECFHRWADRLFGEKRAFGAFGVM